MSLSTNQRQQALVGWFVVWAALVSIPPGHSAQKNVIMMNMVSCGAMRGDERKAQSSMLRERA